MTPTQKYTAELAEKLNVANARIAELEKKIAANESSIKYHSTNSSNLQQELEAVHDVLDALPNAPAKRNPDGYSDRKLTTRLAGYFASNISR